MSDTTVNGYPIQIGAEYVHVSDHRDHQGVHPHRIIVRGTWANVVLAECVGKCQWTTCRNHDDGTQITLSGFGWSPTRPEWVLA